MTKSNIKSLKTPLTGLKARNSVTLGCTDTSSLNQA